MLYRHKCLTFCVCVCSVQQFSLWIGIEPIVVFGGLGDSRLPFRLYTISNVPLFYAVTMIWIHTKPNMNIFYVCVRIRVLECLKDLIDLSFSFLSPISRRSKRVSYLLIIIVQQKCAIKIYIHIRNAFKTGTTKCNTNW